MYQPKFYHELNYIDYFWCDGNCYARQNCKYSLEGLRADVPTALSQVKNSSIFGAYKSYQKNMDLYRDSVTYSTGDWNGIRLDLQMMIVEREKPRAIHLNPSLLRCPGVVSGKLALATPTFCRQFALYSFALLLYQFVMLVHLQSPDYLGAPGFPPDHPDAGPHLAAHSVGLRGGVKGCIRYCFSATKQSARIFKRAGRLPVSHNSAYFPQPRLVVTHTRSFSLPRSICNRWSFSYPAFYRESFDLSRQFIIKYLKGLGKA